MLLGADQPRVTTLLPPVALLSVGAPGTVADAIEDWFTAGAADGLNLRFRTTEDLERFAADVVPLLQKRGVFRTEYEGDTLRANLGLPFPVNRYTQQREVAGTANDSTAPTGDFVSA